MRTFMLILGALLFGCQQSVSTPSGEDIARRLPEFYFKALAITGLYLNHDTDGIIFRYSVAEKERRVWLKRISDTARANGWKVVHEGEVGAVSTLHLRRIDDPKHRYRNQHSLEIIRLSSCGTVLLVGGIQADIKKQSELAKFSTDGTPWYQTTFWPLLVKNQTELCATRPLRKPLRNK